MRRLPLFPLPVVLFPGAVTPLHIFEPRYRQLVARCLEFDRRFGLLYHDPDRMGPFQMEEDRVGTLAEIGEFRILPDGRSLLLAHGHERFRIRDGIESEELYWEGLVEPFTDEGSPDPEVLVRRRMRSVDLLVSVLERLPDLEGQEDLPAVEIDPAEETSFQIAQRIRVDPAWQHALLEIPDEARRLDRIDSLLSDALS